MIALRKSDKLIVIAAVVVIVLAGIGIALYVPPEEEDGTPRTGDMQTFEVTWEKHTTTLSSNQYTAGKNDPYSDEIEIKHDNVMDVRFELSWTDDSVYGILRPKGLDTLTAEITYKGTTKTETSVGNGTLEFEFHVNSMPQDMTIEADDEVEAWDMLEEDYYDTEHPTFTVDVSVQTGERIWRLLRFLRDQGNDFDLEISYDYYDASLSEEETKPSGFSSDDSGFTDLTFDEYKSSGYLNSRRNGRDF